VFDFSKKANYYNPMRGFIKSHIFAILGGICLVLSFPRYDLYPLAWFALAPFLVSLYGKDSKYALRSGLVLGIIYFFGTQYWIYHSVHYYGGMSFALSIFVVFLLSLYMSLYIIVFSVLFANKIKTTRLPAMVLAPVFWVTLEFARSYALTGFPWSSIGYSQYKFLTAIQFSDITGIYGVSFLIVAINGAIADIFITKKRIEKMPLYNHYSVVLGYIVLFFVVISVLGYGFYKLGEMPKGTSFRASVIQASIEQDIKWSPEYQEEVLKIYKSLTIEASSSMPDIIVWPETAVPFYWQVDAPHTDALIEFQKALDTYLLFGAITQKKGGLGNSAILLDRGGNISYTYDKIHLVPFGEYVPLKRLLFFVNRLAVGIGDYVPGKSYLRAKTPFGSFGTLICYEIIFPGLVRKFYLDGGDFIVTITNDAWFGTTNGPYQHWSMAVFRAIENRKPLIRAANTGISGFIDSNGRIISKTRLFQRTSLTEEISTNPTRTFYSRYGDLFSYIVIVFSLFLLISPTKED